MKNRKKAESVFLARISKLAKNQVNTEMYKKFFASLSDAGFAKLIKDISEGVVLPFYSANMGDVPIEIKDVFAVGDDLGINFFERLWITDPVTGVKYLSTEEYMVIDMAVRRQRQHLVKGKSVNVDDRHTDSMTGQAMGNGVSRTSRLSLPEITILSAGGHDSTVEELIKVRGGDTAAYRYSKRSTLDTGEYSLKVASELT